MRRRAHSQPPSIDGRRSPMRTCVGCRREDSQHALVRIVMGPAGELAPDIASAPRLAGRGAYVHPHERCVKAACAGGLSRSFKTPVRADAGALCAMLAARLRARFEGLLLAARRARKMAMGSDAVRAALFDGSLVFLVVASDAQGRREEITAAATRLGRACIVMGDKTELGRLLGRAELGVVGVLDEGIGEALAETAGRLAALGQPAHVPGDAEDG